MSKLFVRPKSELNKLEGHQARLLGNGEGVVFKGKYGNTLRRLTPEEGGSGMSAEKHYRAVLRRRKYKEVKDDNNQADSKR